MAINGSDNYLRADAGNPQDISALHDLTAQQLVRYEALFTLLEDIQGIEDISVIAQQVVKQWKYSANVANWHLLLFDDYKFLIITGFGGHASVRHAEEKDLSFWDMYQWKEHRPALIPVSEIDPEMLPPEHLTGKGIFEIQVLPIIRNEKCIAVLNVCSRNIPFNELDYKYIKLLGNYFADRVSSLVLQKRAFELLNKKATRDALTGILNRGTVLEQLDAMLALGKRSSYPVSIILADVDYFKIINDRHGHQTGDRILQEIAYRLQSVARDSDSVGRYGGEEFLIILNRCSRDQAAIAAERFLKTVADKPFLTTGFSPVEIGVTLSIGTASTDDQAGCDSLDLIKKADNALYISKADGRNRVTNGS